MKSLQQLSVDHLNDAVYQLSEKRRVYNVARVIGDKNATLRLALTIKELESSIIYWRSKVEEERA